MPGYNWDPILRPFLTGFSDGGPEDREPASPPRIGLTSPRAGDSFAKHAKGNALMDGNLLPSFNPPP
jgi:hypothetical protein